MTAQPSATASDIVRVRLAPRGVRHDLRAIKIVWQRDMIRFLRDRLRMVASLLQPVLFLFVLGTGLSQVASGMAAGVDLRTFMFPGVLAMAVLFTAIFSAGSIVWDREFGFMREMLVAPVSRSAIVVGKCLGGATVATVQGLVILCLAGLAGVPYSPTLMITLVGELFLLAFALTAFGVVAAARIRNMQAFMALSQLLLMPLFFLSGALFPLSGLPSWLGLLTHINPLTYAVDPMRRAVFTHLDLGGGSQQALSAGVTWWGWQVPVALELGLVAVLGITMLAVAVAEFRHAE